MIQTCVTPMSASEAVAPTERIYTSEQFAEMVGRVLFKAECQSDLSPTVKAKADVPLSV